MVPLSLLQASQLAYKSKASEYIVAYSEPRRSSCMQASVPTSNMRIMVPFSEAVASLNPLGHNYNAHRVDLWA